MADAPPPLATEEGDTTKAGIPPAPPGAEKATPPGGEESTANPAEKGAGVHDDVDGELKAYEKHHPSQLAKYLAWHVKEGSECTMWQPVTIDGAQALCVVAQELQSTDVQKDVGEAEEELEERKQHKRRHGTW